MGIRTAAALCAIVACMQSPTFAAGCADLQPLKRPVRIIVPTVPGGSSDFMTRLMATWLGDCWGQSVVVENRAGASGMIALDALARAVPDGNTFALFNVTYLLTASLSGKRFFERGGDFTPIARSAYSAILFVIHRDVPAKSVKELVELARAKPRHFNYASGGAGSVGHIGLALFASIAGIELTHVAYRSSAAGFPDLLSGRVQLLQATPVSVLSYVQAGQLRALAISGAKRSPIFPEVPTFAEVGYPHYDVSLWFGIFAPAPMPVPLVARRNADFNWVVQQPEVVDRLSGVGIDPAGGLSPAQFADYIAAETIKWNDALKVAGMR